MRKLLLTAAITCSFVAPASAHYYNELYDCGHGETVWVGNPIIRELHKRVFIFSVTVTHFNLTKSNGVVRSPGVRWQDGKVTLDGRPCRRISDE